MADVSRSSGHRWEGISAHDRAKLHTGHVYGQVNNIHNYAPEESDSATADERAERAWRTALLGWLTFAEIDDRREQVREAHQKTFRWIFEAGNETGFAEWLRSGDGIYWIRGKPASGKSTLVKFITGEPRLQQLLEEWTGSTPLVISSFWFWAAGTPLQRSLIGLYRTLLVQMLKTDPHLHRVAFPDWQIKFSRVVPTMEMLSAAMSKLFASRALFTNFFIIIDGLDEYDRDNIGKAELAELMLNMTKSPRVKCLLSSRPETAFKVAFQKSPHLRLEMLTKPDVLSYVNTRLWTNPFLREISAIEKCSIHEIGDFIVRHAEGVFLWVVLVTDIVIAAINDYDSPQTIRDRIMELPPELNDLFTHIMTKRIPQHHRQEAFRCLTIALRFESEQSTEFITCAFLDAAHQTSNYEIACELVRPGRAEAHSRLVAAGSDSNVAHVPTVPFSHRLASTCQGLLESIESDNSEDPRVTFCHRTLLEYLKAEQQADRLLESGVGTSFDVNTAIMVGLIQRIRLYRKACFGRRIMEGERMRKEATNVRITECFYKFNVLAERSTGHDRGDLIEVFDQYNPNPYTSLVKRLVKNKSKAITDTYLQSRHSLLAYAAHTGSVRYLHAAIARGDVASTEGLSFLLLGASTGSELPSYLAANRSSTADQTPSTIDEYSRLKFRTCRALLHRGADPAYDFEGLCPWNQVLQRIIGQRIIGNLERNITPRHLTRDLRLLLLFAQHAPEVRICRAMIPVQTPFDRRWSGTWMDYEAASKSLMRATCCSRIPLQDCQCDNALAWRATISETSRLLNPPAPRLTDCLS